MIFYTSTPDYYNDYIAHFGILGMKWGKRNGPPYPLGSNVSTGRRLKNTGSVKKKKTSSKVTTYKDPDGNSWKISGTPNKETQKRIKEYEKAKKQAKAYVNLPTPKSVYMPNPELEKRAKEIGDKEVYEVAKGKPIKNIKSPETGFAQKEIDKKNQQALTINKASVNNYKNDKDFMKFLDVHYKGEDFNEWDKDLYDHTYKEYQTRKKSSPKNYNRRVKSVSQYYDEKTGTYKTKYTYYTDAQLEKLRKQGRHI